MLRLIARLFYTAVVLVETLVGVRFILILINANKENTIVKFVLDNSKYFIDPFAGITKDIFVWNNLHFDLQALVALLFYMVIAYIAIELIKAFSHN